MQSSDATQNGINLSKQRFLVNVTEFFYSMSIVHFPEMSSGYWCKCSRKEHGFIRSLCNVSTLKAFVSVPFHIIEMAYRLQKVDAIDSTTNPVEHEEVNITRKIVQLLFLQINPNMMIEMPTTAIMKQN